MQALKLHTTPSLTAHPHKVAGRHGFSIIELLVALIIIGILVTIITPRLAERADEARLTRARQDMENIQNAQEKVFVDIGYMVRLHVLDDVPGGGTGPFAIDNLGPDVPNNSADTTDAIGDEPLSPYFQNPGRIFISPRARTNSLLPLGSATQILNNLLVASNESGFNPRIWNGPYLTYQVDQNSSNFDRSWIGDDPWGSDYLFFTPEGLMVEPLGEVRNSVTALQLGVSVGGPYDADIFDRPTILSLGPDGLPGDGGTQFGQGDDLTRRF